MLFFNVLNRGIVRVQKPKLCESHLRERVDLKKMTPCLDLLF